MTIAFHELSPDAAQAALERGLLQGTSGEKTDDDIAATDRFLNARRPQSLIEKGVDRHMNLYCYLSHGGKIIDISSGKTLSAPAFTAGRPQSLLQVEVDPARCYVSDLDLYDQVMELLKKSDETNATRLAEQYWANLRLLNHYDWTFRRPEVMVTYTIPPSDITRIV